MSTTTGMFKLDPVYDFSNAKLDLPDCMFKMANIHDGGNTSSAPEGEIDPALAALEQRQESILTELESLKTQVAALSSKIQPGVTVQVAAAAVSSGEPSKLNSGCLCDVVIYANPNNPPYSLLVLYELLKQQYRCMTRVHAHSSVSSVPEKLLRYFEENGIHAASNRGDNQLSLTLIWKNVTHGPEMKVKASSQTPIQGEVNILRYLSRLLTPTYDAADITTVTSIDGFLDLTSSTILKGSSKEKAAAVRTLNSTLGKRTWLVGESPTIADIAVWSALHQTGQNSGAPSNVQKWLKACAAQSQFRTAVSSVA
ncbi:aminoacyl tRNA synthase complex-interacting multifunctional protein 2-like [Diadema antillarum]|uniref:aminoacyl tRNA synthase complex-interacting multifunctional protein 2-like n=1 Tax=Diadema antillarum TaxID=105358 RepID=UPI003A8C69D9